MSDLSGKVSTAGQDTGAAIIQLSALARTVVEQPQLPVIKVPGLEDVNKHLATAQTHANNWLNTYSGQMWDRLQGIISFGETFNNLYGALYATAQKMGTETQFQPNEISTLIGSLQALQTLVKQQYNDTNKVYLVLSGYRTDVSGDYAAFLTDYNTANTALGGATGEIAELVKKIAAEHDAMNKDLAMIGGGAAMMVVGILIICCGALLEFETAGLATGIIIAGVAVVGGGAALTGVAGHDYDVQMGHLKDDTKTLADDNAELTMLTGLKGQLNGLDTTLKNAEDVLGNLVTAWQQLDNSINAVVTDLQNPTDYLAKVRKDDPSATPLTVSIIVSAELQTANQDWTDAVTLAKAYLSKGRNIVYLNSGKQAPTQDEIVKASCQCGQPLARRRVSLTV